MIKEVKLPEVSDNVETGDVVKVLVSVGDSVKVDQPLIELETDKAMFEVPSTEEGVVKEIMVKVGDAISIGSVILTLDSEGGKKEEDDKGDDKKDQKEDQENKEKIGTKEDNEEKKETPKKEKEGDSKEEKNIEKKGDSKEGKKGDSKEQMKDDSKEEKKSDTKEEKKGDSEEVEKDDSKEVEKDDSKEGKKDDPEGVKKDDSEGEKKQDSKSTKPKSENEDTKEESDQKADVKDFKNAAAASPSVRRLARELGVDINSVASPGSGERISEADIKKYVRDKISGSTIIGGSVEQKTLPDFEKWGKIEREPLSKVRTITGEAMTYAWKTIPMVTQFDKADITQIEGFRKKNSKKVEEEGGHLTLTSILVKVCSAALKSFPQFNSSIDFANKEIIFKKYFNIGIAVDTDRGLLVPVIKDTDKKNITEISSELNELAEKARNKKLSLDEMDGGNFTISNLGGIGGTSFTPIVYSPQVAILGVSRANKEQVFINEKFETGFMLPLSLTYDHRIIDGADAARFLRWIADALENPMMMVL